MADTTHNVTIKATLDTSTNDSQGRASSPSGGGGGSGNLASGIALASTTFVRSVDVVRHSLSALMLKLIEMGDNLELLSIMYRESN